MNKSKPFLLFAFYLIVSICAIYFASYTRELTHWISAVDLYIDESLALVFSMSPLGVNLRQIISLALTPVLLVLIPALLYHLIKHKMMPYLIPIIWLLWIITALSRLLSP